LKYTSKFAGEGIIRYLSKEKKNPERGLTYLQGKPRGETYIVKEPNSKTPFKIG